MMADAWAALGIIARKGLGKVRHLDINHLWIQQVAVERRARLEKVQGPSNPADLMTNEFLAQYINKCIDMMQAKFVEG